MESRANLPWHVSAIAYPQIQRELLADDEGLMFLLASASFVESGSDLYAHNLVEHYEEYPEIRAWLDQHWEAEELQHGKALAMYVCNIWTDFDWDATFASFMQEYGPTCRVDALEKDRGQEMAARCVVEMGTSSLYHAIGAYATEPVLVDLVGRIHADEVRHYKNFLHYFKEYNAATPRSRWTTAATLYRRMAEIRDEDSAIAMRHVFKARHPHAPVDGAHFRALEKRGKEIVQQHIGIDTAVRMLLAPLDLPKKLQHAIETPLARAANRFMLHA